MWYHNETGELEWQNSFKLLKSVFSKIIKENTYRGCWTWIASARKNGYGKFNITISKNKYKYEYAHRFMWMIIYGEIPNGLHVCHRCDNPSCVNPNRLFLGTPKDNTHDSVIKGRRGRGYKRTRKTHCKHGHEFSRENTYINPITYERACRQCRTDRKEEAILHNIQIMNISIPPY